jgi:hypothetical protein
LVVILRTLIACHTLNARDEIGKLLSAGFGSKLTSVVLTKPLLDLIGTFDKVKRAAYALFLPDANTPTNIQYADDNLGAKRLAMEEEDSSRSSRVQSFYKIPLTSPLLEEGLGVTSETGKLWIPKETPIDLIRQYAIALLGKISGTLDFMAQNQDIEGVLATFSIEQMTELGSKDSAKLREALAELIRTVIVMLATREAERPYAIPTVLLSQGVPEFFNPPLLRLVDEGTQEAAYWKDPLDGSSLIRVTSDSVRGLRISSLISKSQIDMDSLVHPITGAPLNLGNATSYFDVTPSPNLIGIIAVAVKKIAEAFPKLSELRRLHFWISGGLLGTR